MGFISKTGGRVNSMIFWSLLVLSAYSFALGIMKVSSGTTIGQAVKAFMPAGFFLILWIATATLSREDFCPLSRKDDLVQIFNWPVTFFVLGLALVLYLLILLGANTDMTSALLGLLVVTTLVVAFFMALSYDNVYGIAVILITLPFLNFLEFRFKETWMGGGAWGFLALSPSIVLIWCFCLLTLLRQAFRNRWMIMGPLGWYVLAWMALLFISSLLSHDTLISFRWFTLEALVFPLFYFLTVNRVNSKQDTTLLVWAMLGYGFLRMLIVYYFFMRHEAGLALIWYTPFAPQRSSMQYTGLLGLLPQWILPISIALFLKYRERGVRLALLLIIAFSFYVLVANAGRGSIIATLLTFPVFLLFTFRGKTSENVTRILMLLVIMAGLTLFFLQTPSGEHLMNRFSPWREISNILYEQRIRLDCWRSALEIIRDHPFTGIGLGMWTHYYSLYTNLSLPFITTSAHHLFLEYGASGGIATMIILFCLLFMSLIKGLRLVFKQNDKDNHLICCGLVWGLLSFIISGSLGAGSNFAQHPLFSSDELFLALDAGIFPWLTMGLISRWQGLE